MTALPFIGADELRAQTPPEPDWTWTGYLAPGAVTILGGKPKAGKSTLALAVAEAVATEAPSFLGRAIKGRPVVYVSEEGAGTLAHKTPERPELRVLTRDAAWPKPSWADLIAGSREEARRVGAVLLVVDTWAYWAGLAKDAEKDAGTAGQAMQHLLAAAHDGLAVLATGHLRKSGGEDGDALRGSGAIAGAADLLLELKRAERSSERVLLALSRYPSTPGSLLIDRDPATGAWRAIAPAHRDGSRLLLRRDELDDYLNGADTLLAPGANSLQNGAERTAERISIPGVARPRRGVHDGR